jgi:hypothetical protein
MANEIMIGKNKPKKAKRGERMTYGSGWRLVVVKGNQRLFVGTLLWTHNAGNKRIAVFSVPK